MLDCRAELTKCFPAGRVNDRGCKDSCPVSDIQKFFVDLACEVFGRLKERAVAVFCSALVKTVRTLSKEGVFQGNVPFFN